MYLDIPILIARKPRHGAGSPLRRRAWRAAGDGGTAGTAGGGKGLDATWAEAREVWKWGSHADFDGIPMGSPWDPPMT